MTVEEQMSESIRASDSRHFQHRSGVTMTEVRDVHVDGPDLRAGVEVGCCP